MLTVIVPGIVNIVLSPLPVSIKRTFLKEVGPFRKANCPI